MATYKILVYLHAQNTLQQSFTQPDIMQPSLEKGNLVPRPSQSSFCSIRFCILQAFLTERPGNDAQKDRHTTNVPVLHTTNDTRLMSLVMCVGKQDAICRSILTTQVRRILLHLHV